MNTDFFTRTLSNIRLRPCTFYVTPCTLDVSVTSVATRFFPALCRVTGERFEITI